MTLQAAPPRRGGGLGASPQPPAHQFPNSKAIAVRTARPRSITPEAPLLDMPPFAARSSPATLSAPDGRTLRDCRADPRRGGVPRLLTRPGRDWQSCSIWRWALRLSWMAPSMMLSKMSHWTPDAWMWRMSHSGKGRCCTSPAGTICTSSWRVFSRIRPKHRALSNRGPSRIWKVVGPQ